MFPNVTVQSDSQGLFVLIQNHLVYRPSTQSSVSEHDVVSVAPRVQQAYVYIKHRGMEIWPLSEK